MPQEGTGWKALMKCFWRWKNTNALRWKQLGGTWWARSHFLFCKEEFLVVHRKGGCAHPSPEHPGVGRPAGLWKAQPLELGMEPGELAARAFPSPGDCKVFVPLLSLSHSFILNETYWFAARRRGKNNPAITKCPYEVEKLGFTQLCSKKKKKERGERGSLKAAHRSGGGWWSVPGIPPPRCQMGPGDRSQREAARCCETQKGKKVILK